MNEQTLTDLVSAVTTGQMSSISAERLLNAIARAQAGVPTGIPTNTQRQDETTSGGTTHSH